MNLKQRIDAFTTLGKILRDSLSSETDYSENLNAIINRQQDLNKWFTPSNVRFAIDAIANELTADSLNRWTSSYPGLDDNTSDPLKTGLIFAGNIPMAGFHDFLSILISGKKLIAKISSKDTELIPFISGILCSVEPGFNGMIEFTNGMLKGFDMIIATGSNNSSRYFEYYFGKYPRIIRKNRNSIAILDGSETAAELRELGKDVFTYFGMGCRNVSKIYLPEGYDMKSLIPHWDSFSDIINHSGYANNYDYNKAIYLVNRQDFLDAGHILLREDVKLSSPVSVLNYEYYRSANELLSGVELLRENIQCVVSRKNIPFGHSQLPHLWDYADGTDTINFLLKKNLSGIS